LIRIGVVASVRLARDKTHMSPAQPEPSAPAILVDADACPVKDEVYRVAERYGVAVTIVANSFIRIPDDPLISRVIVSDGFDAADDWIAEQAHERALVITADILLAERCLEAGAAVLSPKGTAFTENSIGGAVATRAIMVDLTAGGEQIGGPAPFTRADRSRFLQAMDAATRRLLRPR
jgi:uncharacterized protein YaiI (UPF0178 family)